MSKIAPRRSPVTDIVERLRAKAWQSARYQTTKTGSSPKPIKEHVCSEAADEITRLRSQLAEAGEALEAVLYETVDAGVYPDGPCLHRDTRAEIRITLERIKEAE